MLEVAVFMKYHPAERIYLGHHTLACPRSLFTLYTLSNFSCWNTETERMSSYTITLGTHGANLIVSVVVVHHGGDALQSLSFTCFSMNF